MASGRLASPNSPVHGSRRGRFWAYGGFAAGVVAFAALVACIAYAIVHAPVSSGYHKTPTAPPLVVLSEPLPTQPPPAVAEAPAESAGAIQEDSVSEGPPAPAWPPTAIPSSPLLRESAPLPPIRPPGFGPEPTNGLTFRATGLDKWTAVYDIKAHVVYLPDGSRLEAHSGLGKLLDDPNSVSERDKGATPPHLYQLEPREELFHGVFALRLTPIGDGDLFGRTGLLAHTYMLGPRGDSNGCVSFKDYPAFLRAYQSGEVKRLAVVARRED
jgi:hypothetical protein